MKAFLSTLHSILFQIDRVPSHIREPGSSLTAGHLETHIKGLTDRFKNNWGARFGGLIDVPESGNWTFYLNTDDGSELWINSVSTIQNYGEATECENITITPT